MNEADRVLVNLVGISLLRLRAPEFVVPTVVSCEPTDLAYPYIESLLKDNATSIKEMETVTMSQFLHIPAHHKKIYVGETLACYVSIYNKTSQVLRQIYLNAYLQFSTETIRLTPDYDEYDVATVKVDGAIGNVIMGEIEQAGKQTLYCDVLCYELNCKRMGIYDSFREVYTFDAADTFEVVTTYQETDSEDFYLEIQVKNLTTYIVVLETVELICSRPFKEELVNNVGNGVSIFGDNLLAPQEVTQYLFRLSPSDNLTKAEWVAANKRIGNIYILWSTSLGQAGKYLSPTLERKLSSKQNRNFMLTYENVPGKASVGKVFNFNCKIVNKTGSTLDLVIELSSVVKSSFLWYCQCNKKYSLASKATVTVDLAAVCLNSGLQCIKGLSIKDLLLNKSYHDFNQVSVAVYQN